MKANTGISRTASAADYAHHSSSHFTRGDTTDEFQVVGGKKGSVSRERKVRDAVPPVACINFNYFACWSFLLSTSR